ncbi:hypothetical protein IFM89_025091 [Coptis chinensis]|uniref:Uncharacterized protein n=1 Tax=Coptis chinensis TaxID=261450 RepID=A0A835HYC2_9MAGN|nr:hypothetical protein IFM89_025091 [Coptis chinensis]
MLKRPSKEFGLSCSRFHLTETSYNKEAQCWGFDIYDQEYSSTRLLRKKNCIILLAQLAWILCISDLNVAVIICDPIGEPKPHVPKSGAWSFIVFPLQGMQQGALSSGGCVNATLLTGPLLAPKSVGEAALQGIVQDVDPVTIFGNRRLGKGNFKVYVKSIIYRSTKLPFPHDQQSSRTLGQIGLRSVIWPKSLLVPLTQ